MKNVKFDVRPDQANIEQIIQLFKNLKLEREMYVLDCRTHPLDVHKLFPLVINIILEFFEWLYLVQYRPNKRQT